MGPAIDCLAYLDGLTGRGIRPGLEGVHAALERLGHPEDAYGLVRVAGTNGKGSVAVLTAAALQESGHRVGLFLSPHLVDVRERIRVDGSMLDPAPFAAAVHELRTAIERPPEIPLTYFEFLAVLAFLRFRDARVDVAVLEAGLGGRWDGTNAGRAAVAVLTNVELDHTRHLGSTRRRIAAEKVRIASDGRPLVTGPRAGGRPRRGRDLLPGARHRARPARSHGALGPRPAGHPALPGPASLLRRPRARAGSCLPAAERGPRPPGARGARRDGTERGPGRGLRAFAGARWPGRLERIEGQPAILLDGAHNPHGARALAGALAEIPCPGRRVLVAGILERKPAREILDPILGAVTAAVLCDVPGHAAMDPAGLARVGAGRPLEAVRDPEAALDRPGSWPAPRARS